MVFNGEPGPAASYKGPTPFGAFSYPPPPNPNPNPNPISDGKTLFPPVQPPPRRRQSPPRSQRPALSPCWDNQPNQPVNPSYVMNTQRLSPVEASCTAHNAEAINPTKPYNVNVPNRTRSPTFPPSEEDSLGLYSRPGANAKRHGLPSNLESHPMQPVNRSYFTSPQSLFPVAARNTTCDSEVNISAKSDGLNIARRTRSPPFPFHVDGILGLYNPPNTTARRKWKERATFVREIWEQREFLANVALSSLTLGPPVRRQSGETRATEELNIDNVAKERFGKLGKSWAIMNVSELVAPILSSRDLDAKCVSWKLVFVFQANDTESQTYNLALKWLHTKRMGSDMGIDDELLVSQPGLSIWNK